MLYKSLYKNEKYYFISGSLKGYCAVVVNQKMVFGEGVMITFIATWRFKQLYGNNKFFLSFTVVQGPIYVCSALITYTGYT